MIGPDHYRRAEELLDRYMLIDDDDQEAANALAAAQVHATLALASATALAIDPTPEALCLWDEQVLEDDVDSVELGATGQQDSTGAGDTVRWVPEVICGATDPTTDLPCLIEPEHDGLHRHLGFVWSR